MPDAPVDPTVPDVPVDPILSDARVDPTVSAALDQRLARAQRDHRLPSTVAGVIREGRLVWSGGCGALDGRLDGPSPTADTQYRIGSITKTFTAVMIMVLRDAGRLTLGDRVDDHLSGTPYGGARLEQLLSHTGGLPAETGGPWWERVDGSPWAELITTVVPPVHPVGARHHYSNLGFAVLGQVIAELTGTPWLESVTATILDPLELRRTTARPVSPAAPGWAVHPFTDQLHPEPDHDARAMAPAGQLWSTVSDLAHWAGFLAGDVGDVISRDTLAEMLLIRSIDDDAAQAWTSGKGLGWQVWNHDGVRSAGHFGSMPGFQAGLVVDLATGDGAVSMTNSTAGPSPSPRELITALGELSPRTPAPWHRREVSDETAALVGTWFWGPRPSLLRIVDGELVLGDPGRARGTRLRPAGDGTWLALDGYFEGETLRVVRSADGTPTHLDLATFRFTRTPYDPAGDIPGGVEGGWS